LIVRARSAILATNPSAIADRHARRDRHAALAPSQPDHRVGVAQVGIGQDRRGFSPPQRLIRLSWAVPTS
jgi:hypothetical protein